MSVSAEEFTGEKCPVWLDWYPDFAMMCAASGDECEPTPADLARVCEEWLSNEECYTSTEEVAEAFAGFQGACTSGTSCAPALTLDVSDRCIAR